MFYYSGEVRTLLIGCLSLAGVVLLLVLLQTIGLVCFMCKNTTKTKTKMIKRGATHIEYETYATDNDDDDKRISTDYDYMK